MNKNLLAAAAVFTLALAGLANLTSASAQQPSDARVRVIHASPDAPNVDVYANDNKVLSDVAFPAASEYLTVPAGNYNFKVFAAGANPANDEPVIDADATLAAGKDYTVAAVGLVADIEPAVYEDNNAAPAAGKAHVRILHASPDAPNVDIAVKDGPVLFPDLAFPNAAGPSPVDAGTYDLEVRAAGTTTVALPLDDVALTAGKIYTVVAIGLLEGDPELSVLTIADDPRVSAAPPAPAPSPAPGAPAPAPAATHNLPATGMGTGEGSAYSPWLIGAMAVAFAATGIASITFATRRQR